MYAAAEGEWMIFMPELWLCAWNPPMSAGTPRDRRRAHAQLGIIDALRA